MKKNLVRAALVASLSLFVAGAVFTPTPAAAADKPQQTVSKAASKSLVEANKAILAKDWATALVKLKETQAISGLTDYDKYIMNYYMGIAYLNSGDKAAAELAYVAAAESLAAPEEERATSLRMAMALNNDTQNYARIIELGRLVPQNGTIDDVTAAILAIAYYNTADYANAQMYADKSIAAATAAGQTPNRSAYQIMLNCQIKKKDFAAATRTLEIMVNAYGESDDWNNLITIDLGTLSTFNKNYRDLAALYLYRLGLTVGANFAAVDYQSMHDAAQVIHSFGDAQHALRTGIDKGILSRSKFAAALTKVNADAARDEPTLSTADNVAAKSPSANSDVSVAEAYYGYGRYADAARVAQRAIAKGGPKAMEAQLLLGVAQVQQGDNTAAAQSLALVKGDPAMERAAKLWTLYATRKYSH